MTANQVGSRRGRKLSRLAGALALVAATAATAGQFEPPPSYSPAAALGPAWKGASYRVSSPVTSDGFLRHYTVRTGQGDFEVTGDQLMAARLEELAALKKLDEINVASQFGQQAVKTGLSPVLLAGALITNPVGTTRNTIGGVGQFFGGVTSGLNNFGKSRDDPFASVTGQARQKREIASALGIDPYTDFSPLAARLDAVAGAGAAGSLAVAGAFMLTPGVAGLVASNANTASSLGAMVKDYSSAQLMDIDRERLARLGVDRATADRLLANRYFTPVDDTAIVSALESLAGAGDLPALVSTAAGADSRATAYFIRRRIELTAAWRRRYGPIAGFADPDDLRFPVAKTANGLVGVYPIDALAWTPETARVLEGMTAAGRGAKTLAITGTATPLARSRLKALGWTLEERTRL